MGKRLPLPLGLKIGHGQAQVASCENLINLYPEVARGKALSPVHLLGIPGQTSFSTIGGTRRGQFRAGTNHLAVRGEALYTIDSLGAATNRGTITGVAKCRFAHHADYVAIVADIKSYYYTISTSIITEITDADFVQANDVTVAAGLFVFSRVGTGQIAWPSTTDVFAFDGLDFAEAETSPDELTGLHESAQELLCFGTDTLEPFRFTGNPDQYFEASTSAAAIKVGTRWRDTIRDVDNAPFWLATNREGALYVARLEGYNGKRISTHQVENSLEKAPAASLALASAFSYSQRGHAFYVLTIPGHCTWAFDVSTGEWAQRLSGSWPAGTPEIPQGDWGVDDFCVNNARQPILGKTDGNLYTLNFGSFSQDSAGIVREVTTPPFTLGGVSFTISEIELICATGVGLEATAPLTPDVQLLLSYDSGKTWSDPFIEKLGPLGEYGRGVRFNRLGRCPGPKGVAARFRCSDAVDFTPVEAFITIDPGTR